MRFVKLLHVSIGLILLLVPSCVQRHPSSATATHSVRSGQSIQTTLEASKPGDTVVVGPGIYRENLEIVKSGITLIGHGAVLEAPTAATVPHHCLNSSDYTENPFGICIS